MTTQNGRAFNEWLRAQLKAKKMSQRQLAQQSGVDHSTISRLIRGDRMPSLGTATKLARGLREIREDADAAQYLGLVANGTQNPTARVEYALRADEALSEAHVRQIMEYYLAVRMRRFGRVFHGADSAATGGSTGSIGDAPGGHANGSLTATGAGPVSGTNGSSNGHTSGSANGLMGGVGAGTAVADTGRPRPMGYAVTPVPSLTPRVAVATRVTTSSTMTRPSGRTTDRY